MKCALCPNQTDRKINNIPVCTDCFLAGGYNLKENREKLSEDVRAARAKRRAEKAARAKKEAEKKTAQPKADQTPETEETKQPAEGEREKAPEEGAEGEGAPEE